jgi:hypothetical protein
MLHQTLVAVVEQVLLVKTLDRRVEQEELEQLHQ